MGWEPHGTRRRRIRDEVVEEVLKGDSRVCAESPEFESEAEDEGLRKTLKELQGRRDGPANAEIQMAYAELQKTTFPTPDHARILKIQRLWNI